VPVRAVREKATVGWLAFTQTDPEETAMSQTSHARALPSKGQADADPYSIPLERIDMSDSELFEKNAHWRYFERLRKEAPVHYCAQSDFGPFWSVTKYDDIVHVEKNPEIYSSARSIAVLDPPEGFPLEAGFITMDGDKHDAYRKVAQPVASPRNLKVLEPLIRQRACEILDALPVGETFDWVDRVSIELTTSMLATLFDFPCEQRRKLTLWSEMATTRPDVGLLRRPVPIPARCQVGGRTGEVRSEITPRGRADRPGAPRARLNPPPTVVLA
jgi:cytochrome P450